MYNNAPPPPPGFRPQGGNFPNFPPQGQSAMPPFPGNGHAPQFRPPFAPSMPPGSFPPFPPGGQNPNFRPPPPGLGAPPGFPPQHFPPGFSPQNFPPPQQGFPPGYPPQGMPPQGLPPQGLPPNQQFGASYPHPGMMSLRPPFPPMAGSPPGPQHLGQTPQAPAGSPLPMRPPPGPANMYPSRAGLGSNGPPGSGPSAFDPMTAGLPRPPHLVGGDNPNFIKAAVKTTAVFLGGIPAGITDQILTGLIHTCGPVHKINRVIGATGKAQAFGFAEFEDPEVVLRCLKCLNGVELPDITPQGRRQGIKKTLVVKADEKTKEFLDEYEKNMMRTEHDEEQDISAKRRIATIIDALHDPSADLASILPSMAASDVMAKPTEEAYEIPAHLKDLDENELPENQRGVVLDQISMFREQAAKREADKKRAEEERESRRIAPTTPAVQGSRQGYGQSSTFGNTRQFGGPQGPGATPYGPRGMGNGPQNYNSAPGFVRAESIAGKQGSDLTDEALDEMRGKQLENKQNQELRDRRIRLEQRQRLRQERLNSEAELLRSQTDLEDRDRRGMLNMLLEWDDDEKAARGREVFFADRGRWRNMRQARRRTEYQADVRDRQVEAVDAAALEKESEAFIEKQMAEMADLESKKRAAGHLLDDSAPIKLAIAPTILKTDTVAASSSSVTEPVKPKAKPSAAFGGDEEDEEEVKKKRTLIKLDEGTSEADRLAKNNAKLVELKVQLPTRKSDLFSYPLLWDALSVDLMQRKILPFIRSKMTEFLGELEDDDLVQFVVQHLQDKGSAQGLVEGLEPVLDDDAESFAIGLWTLLIFESAAYEAGLATGSMMI